MLQLHAVKSVQVVFGYGDTFSPAHCCKYCSIVVATAIPMHSPNHTSTSVGDDAVEKMPLLN